MTLADRDLTVFLAVVSSGSFGRAASDLLVAQPTVSERIAQLERTLGTTLFERGARGVVLTEAGRRLVPYAERSLGLLAEATSAVRGVEHRAPLRIAVHVTFAQRAVPLVLGAVGDGHRIVVRDAHTNEVIAMLLDGVADIGFVTPGARPPALRFVPLPTDSVVAVCGDDHPLAARQQVSLAALAGHRVAVNRWGPSAADFIERLLAAGGSEDDLTECSDGVTALRLARDHGHVALVTESMAADHLRPGGGVVRLRMRPALRWRVPLALAFRRRDAEEPRIAAVRRAVAALGPSGPSRARRR